MYMGKFKVGDRVEVKDSCNKVSYGKFGIITNTLNIVDKINGERVYQHQVTFKDDNVLKRYDYLYFFEEELEHSAWDTKLGELL